MKVSMLDDQAAKHNSKQNRSSSQRAPQSGKAKKSVELGGDRTLGCRYELKYHITESTAAAIARHVGYFLQMDRYSKLHRRGDYPIVSLYLDSEDMQLCRESLRGHKNRFKLRVRSYTDEPEYPRFFEIKRRLNTVIMKSRARVMDRDVPALLAGLSLPPQDYTADVETINQFQLYMKSIQAKPAVLVRYMRQAFEGDSNNRVRVTFDRELAYKVTNMPDVRLGGSGWRRNPFNVNGVILEIKFTGHFPAWLSEMAKCFNLRQRSISKYASSIENSCALRFCAPQLGRIDYG